MRINLGAVSDDAAEEFARRLAPLRTEALRLRRDRERLRAERRRTAALRGREHRRALDAERARLSRGAAR